MSRIALQVVLALVALVALFTGVEGAIGGAMDPFYGLTRVAGSLDQVNLDSNFRYFNGVWLGVGIALVALIPRVERRGEGLLVLAVLVFVGGLGRVISVFQHGLPHPGFVAATLAELLFPLLVPWQRALARRADAPVPRVEGR